MARICLRRDMLLIWSLARWIRRTGPFVARFALAGIILGVAGLAPAGVRIRQRLEEARAIADQGDLSRTLIAYEHVLVAGGTFSAVYRDLVSLSMASQRYDDALVYLYALADHGGWTDEMRSQLRRVLEQNGDQARAGALLYASANDPAADPDALRQLARDQIARLKWQEARITLERLIALVPEDAEALFGLGALSAFDDPTEAERYLAAAAADPAWSGRAEIIRQALAAGAGESRTDALTALGIGLLRVGQWSLAEGALTLAVEANAVNPTALAYRGYVRDRQGRDGLPDIEAALAMNPVDPTVYYLMGQHWRLAGDDQAAYEAFHNAFWLAPQNPALAAEVGTSLQRLGDLAGAEEWLRRAVDLAPGEREWRRLLAAFYADTGFRLEVGGLEFVQQASEQAPDDPDLQASLGWAYYQVGEYERAYDALSAAVGRRPTDARARYYFAVVLEYMGDRQGAVDSYRAIVESSGPDSGYGVLATRALERLGWAG